MKSETMQIETEFFIVYHIRTTYFLPEVYRRQLKRQKKVRTETKKKKKKVREEKEKK